MINRKTFVEEIKNKYSSNDIVGYIESFKKLNVLVVGEVIIDEYQYGYTLGKSGKFPIVSFKNESIEKYKGGVIAVNNHIKEFVNKVDYWTDKNIIIKKRYIENERKIFETYSIFEDEFYSGEKEIKDYDLVIVADFGHGFLDKEKRKKIEKESNFLALNTQNNSGNMGMNTINKYNRWDYISLDEIEVRLACSNQFDKIEDLIKEKFKKEIVSITENKYGCYVYKDNSIMKIPAFADNIIDTVGAGDAFLSITSLLAYNNAPIEIIGLLGNFAGAIACGWEGNKEYITRKKMMNFINEKLK